MSDSGEGTPAALKMYQEEAVQLPMKMVKIQIQPTTWRQICTHSLQASSPRGYPVEQLSFLLANRVTIGAEDLLLVSEVIFPKSGDLVRQQAAYVVPSKTFIDRILKRCKAQHLHPIKVRGRPLLAALGQRDAALGQRDWESEWNQLRTIIGDTLPDCIMATMIIWKEAESVHGEAYYYDRLNREIRPAQISIFDQP